ncbi:MAG TPA: dihydrofolate reductase [Devosiaceae bacterium]|jgi:dihydrofolate reductase|nr:dihydrofolate reductase [Devosiaceae bacterium]
MSVVVAMIAGVAENGVIGADGRIPWRIPSDMGFFKRMTMGKPIIMGRKQYESVGKPLPGRTNIVVTRQPGYQPEGVIVVNDLEAAIEHARTIAQADGASEVMIIGGGEIYSQALRYAERLYISHIALAPEGEIRFPAVDPAAWRIVDEPAVEPSPKDEAAFLVRVYERVTGPTH